MTKYVALIRGIGPGDPRTTNQKLKETLESLGFLNVKTVISSGNVIFESDETDTAELAERIEFAWQEKLDFEGITIVKSQAQLAELLDSDPFNGAPHGASSYLLITFFKNLIKPDFKAPYQPEGKVYKIVGYTDTELFSITDNSAVKTSDLMTWIEKRFGKEGTSRTPMTIQKILAAMEKGK